MCPHHHSALWLSGEWLTHSDHLLVRVTGGADDLHTLALNGVRCNTCKHARTLNQSQKNTHKKAVYLMTCKIILLYELLWLCPIFLQTSRKKQTNKKYLLTPSSSQAIGRSLNYHFCLKSLSEWWYFQQQTFQANNNIQEKIQLALNHLIARKQLFCR